VTPLPILDTHQHLVYADRWPYSWTNDISALAGKSFTYDDYCNAIQDTGISAALFMETSPDDPLELEESRWAASLAGRQGSIVRGIIAGCRPEGDHFSQWMESVVDLPIVGARRILHVMPDELSQTARFAENVRKLAARNWTFDLCLLQRQLPIGVSLARKCPEVQFVLDHCGVPDIQGGDFNVWRVRIRDLAREPNVACKISGVAAYCSTGEDVLHAVRPYVEYCIAAFGWDRVVWGSDWPVCLINASLRHWVKVTREIISGEDLANQRKLLFENAARIYHVPPI
jgi:predicted TIM-barrel fold metal-dependent hydrolase